MDCQNVLQHVAALDVISPLRSNVDHLLTLHSNLTSSILVPKQITSGMTRFRNKPQLQGLLQYVHRSPPSNSDMLFVYQGYGYYQEGMAAKVVARDRSYADWRTLPCLMSLLLWLYCFSVSYHWNVPHDLAASSVVVDAEDC